VLEPIGANDGDGVIDDRIERRQSVPDAARRAGEVHDESSVTSARDPAG